MNVTEFGLIQRTSVVTLSVAGIFKEVAVIFVSTIIFHDRLTPINISGLIVTLFGIGLYNWLKYNQFTSGEAAVTSKAGKRDTHIFNAGDETALFIDEASNFEAPMHSLGDDDSSASSARSSLEIPSTSNNPYMRSNDTSLALHRMPNSEREREQEEARIEGFETEIGSDAKLLQLDDLEHEVQESLDRGIKEHHAAALPDDWLLLADDEDEPGKHS